MKRKYMIAAAACIFLLIAGICYSYAYKKEVNEDTFLTLDGQQEKLPEGAPDPENHEGQNAPDEVLGAELSKAGTEREAENPENTKTQDVEADTVHPVIGYVHICGAVNHPGVYEFGSDSRLVDLIEQAGGFTAEAAENYINQAQRLEDGERIYIPTEKEVSELLAGDYISGGADPRSPEQNSSGTTGSELININTATAEELMELPGIGEAKANGIIEYRDTNGKFKEIEDLMKISGIKEGLFQKISGHITVK